MSFLKVYLLNLNLFEPDDDGDAQEDEYQHHSNIVATRVYLLSLGVLLISVAFILWLNTETIIVTLHHPTMIEFKSMPPDAQCSCSRISIPYGEFISLHSSFHQVCSSDFVSDRWMKAVSIDMASLSYDPTDFRYVGGAQFQALAGFCYLSKTSAINSITSLDMNTYISTQVLSESVIRSQIQSTLDQFRSTAPNSLKYRLDIIGQMNKQFISGLQRNFYLQYRTDDVDPYILIDSVSYESIGEYVCDCFGFVDCYTSANIYNNTSQILLLKVPGIVTGCLPVNSMMYSTLECFYNQTCVDILASYFPTNDTFNALKLDENSRFDVNSMVKSIVDSMMVEEWTINVSYSKYYDECAPNLCTYSQVKRRDMRFILTKLLGLLGGLTLVLSFIIPSIIRFLRQPRNTLPTPKVPLHARLNQYKTLLKKVVIELNLFQQQSSNDRQVYYQRIATRIYICMLISSLTVLATYTLLSVSIYHETEFKPTSSKYIELEQKYPSSLSCQCSVISIPYSTFITMHPQFHQACSSDLVTYEWLEYTFAIGDDSYYYLGDYRLYAGSQFQTLVVFCSQAEQVVTNALDAFIQTQFVNSHVISPQIFESQFQSLIKNWQFTTTSQLLRIVKLILATTHGNGLTSGHLNIDFILDPITRKTKMMPQTYDNCSCALKESCRETMSISEYNFITNDFNIIFDIPNFFVGCFLIDSFFASTLECFYNRSCMVEIDKYMYMSQEESFHFTPLNPNLNSPNETIESLVNKLMVDYWVSNTSFTSYYEACAPLTCTYDYERRMDLFLVITTIVSIFGGLSLGLKFLLLIILQLIEYIMSGVSYATLMSFIKTFFICRDERQTTRHLHFVLIVITLSIVYLISTFTHRLVNIQVQKPSLSTYEDLAKRFPSSLQCPCSDVSMEYESFLTIEPRFHQVCSSDFVSDRWIVYLYGEGDLIERFSPTDFRYSASAQFQLLASLCRFSQGAINDTLMQLVTSDFMNANLLSVQSLNERIQSTIDEFKATIPSSYVSTLTIVRETTGSNMLLSSLITNWVIDTPTTIVHESKVHMKPLMYGECSCGVSSKCVQPSRNMHVGCYALEALLQSTLHCFYDQNCTDPTNNFQAMNVSSLGLNHFSVNATIESIVNQLMVEEYSSTIFYEKYFDQCKPSSCIYSYNDRSSVIDGITYLIGLYGGLMIVCRAVAVTIVRLLWHRTTKVTPIAI
ncbi:hypothetical protein I4U23_011647 [Adineta vaga]|nr:hypothetical protein I4U23_011647 [Adineta vaga]